MKKFLKYSAIGLAAVMGAAIIGPMLVGLLIGGAIAYGGYWLYERNDSTVMKVIGIAVIITGVTSAMSASPLLFLLAIPAIGYVVYKLFANDSTVTGTVADPFDNFEKEWKKLSK